MKIVDKAVKKVYRFNCPNCQSRLEGESKEFEDIGGKISKFFCPVCKKDRYITSPMTMGSLSENLLSIRPAWIQSACRSAMPIKVALIRMV